MIRASLPLRVAIGLIPLGFAVPLPAQDRSPMHVVASDPLSPAEQLQKFHVPPGFEVQLVAAEPDVRKPINLAFDHRGRLYVTQSVEYPYPAKEGQEARDSVKLLHDFDAAGRARQIATFADGLNIPIGIVPLSDGAIVYSIPNLYRCWDSDGDGRSERREVLYREFGFRDTHGMCNNLRRWVDGWIYACHGFSNTSTLAGQDGQAVTMQSGNTFRMRPDGSHVEQFTHGQVNPFGLSFDPLGNLYSADCHTRPLYMLLRGAWYPSFGKPHDGLGFGPQMCRHSHESTGIAGVVYYAADHFPPQYRETVFIGNPITNRINHDRLQRHGAMYSAVELPDFLSCDDRWFRPVDVCLGPDGALYIADFYNRIIGHYEVPLDHPGRDRERGRIWRVVYKGDAESPTYLAMPNIAKLGLNQLVELLEHPNLTLRVFAVNELVDRFGAEGIPPLRRVVSGAGSPPQRAFGLWALERLGQLDAGLVTRLAADSAAMVRVHLIKALAERPNFSGLDAGCADLVRGRLKDEDAFVCAAAADALARHASIENVRPLVQLWRETDTSDTHLIHTVRMALRDQLLQPGILARVQGEVDLQSDDARRLAEVCLGAATAESAAFVFAWLSALDKDSPALADYTHHAARHLTELRMPELVSLFASRPSWRRPDVLRSFGRGAQERGAKLPGEIAAAAHDVVRRLLGNQQEARVKEGIELARELRLSDLQADLARHVARDARHAALRPLALEACIAVDAASATPLAAALLVDSEEPFPVRQKAAQVLATLPSEAARDALLAALRTAPERVSVEIAGGLAGTRAGADRLLTAMSEGKASPQLLLEPVVSIRLDLNQPPQLAERRAMLTAGLPPRDLKLRQMIERRREGFQKATLDPAAGQRLFAKTCAACHKLGEQGNKIGPELDGVANRGLDRLLEDLLDPSRNVDQAFRSTVLATTDGRALSGLALREEGQVLVLADAQGKEVRVPLAEIAERSVSPLSPMPANLIDILSEADFYQLVGFLLEQRAKSMP
jgi:putative heme-binding domain-containing protein